MFPSNKTAESISQSNKVFYSSLWDRVFCDAFPRSQASFYNAHELYDYAAYRWNHDSNKTRSLMTSGDLEKLRHLAWQEQALKHADTSVLGSPPNLTSAIAGRTLCSRVADLFAENIESGGKQSKLNLAFTSHEPFLGFFSLTGLAVGGPDGPFSQLPNAGASLTFELFSVDPDETAGAYNGNNTDPCNWPNTRRQKTCHGFENKNNKTIPFSQRPLKPSKTPPYPPTASLYVRVLYQNPSASESPPIPYGLFNSPSTSMPFGHFDQVMRGLGVPNATTWCKVCESEATVPFCVGAVPRPRRRMNHVLAGMLGAAGTLAVLGGLAVFL